eukprot:1725803-Ditylum_brightwellii.AAC.1
MVQFPLQQHKEYVHLQQDNIRTNREVCYGVTLVHGMSSLVVTCAANNVAGVENAPKQPNGRA